MKKISRAMSCLMMTAAGLQAVAEEGVVKQVQAGAWHVALVERQQAEAERAARSQLMLQILDQRQELDGRSYDQSWARSMESYLDRLPLEELEQALDLLRQGDALPAGILGDVNQDLVFTPLATPCRVYDSRNVAAGRLTPDGEDRSFIVAGGSIPPDQGASTSCSVLDSAVAVVINVLAVDPLGKGNFQMWPSDGSPGDSVINFGGPSLGINLINGIMVPICNRFRGPCPSDLMLRTNFAASHAVVNVTGFFSPPEPSPLDCTTMSDFRDATLAAFNFTSPACPAGYSLTGGGYDFSGNPREVIFEQLSPENFRFRCRGGNFGSIPARITCFARCCRIPGRFGDLVP